MTDAHDDGDHTRSPLGEHIVLVHGLESSDRFAHVAGSVSPEDFDDDACREIFRAATELHQRGERVTHATVSEHVRASTFRASDESTATALSDVAAYLEMLRERPGVKQPNADERRMFGILANHAGTVARLGSKRRLRDALRKAADALDAGKDPTADVEHALRANAARVHVGDVDAVLDELQREWEDPTRATPTGLAPLNGLLRGGLRPGDVIALAGIAGGGKSALACQVAYDAAAAGAVVLYASVELPAREVVARWLAMLCFREVLQGKTRALADSGYGGILSGKAYEKNEAALGRAREKLREHRRRLYVRQVPPGSTVSDVRAMLNEARRKAGNGVDGKPRPALLVVDPLQRFFASESGARKGTALDRVNADEVERVGAVAQELKHLADVDGVAVIFTSDTTKSAAAVAASSSQTLRGSYMLNHLATVVLGMHANAAPDALREKLGPSDKAESVAPEVSDRHISGALPQTTRDAAKNLGPKYVAVECSKNRFDEARSFALGFIAGASCFVGDGSEEGITSFGSFEPVR